MMLRPLHICLLMSMYLESCWSWIGLLNFCICLFWFGKSKLDLKIWDAFQRTSQSNCHFYYSVISSLDCLHCHHHLSESSQTEKKTEVFSKYMATSFRTCGWLTGHSHYRRCRYHCHLYRPHHHDHCNIDCYHHHQEIALTALITCIRRRTQEAILAASNCPD